MTILNTLLVVAAVGPIVAAAFIAYFLFTGRSLDMASRRLEAVSVYLASTASEQLESVSRMVSSAAKIVAKHPNEASLALQAAIESDDKLRLIFVLNPDLKSESVSFSSKLPFQAGNYLGLDFSSDVAAVKAKETGQPSWSPSYLSSDGTPVISLAVPAGPKMLLAQVDLSILRKIPYASLEFPGFQAAVVDGQGIAVYSTIPEVAEQRQNLWSSAAVQNALKKFSGSVQERIMGTDCLVGYSSIPHTKWAILVWEPRASVLARNLQTIRLMTILAFLAVVAATGFSFLASKRLIRPLNRVISATERIARGEPAEPPERSKIVEIGQLADAVHRMGLAIHDRQTKLMETNEALRESERKYRNFLDTAQEAIWAFGADTLTSYVNPALCRLLGYSASEMIGRKSDDFIAPEELEEHRSCVKERICLEMGNYQRTFVAKDGRKVYCHVLASPIVDGQGRFAGAIATMTDITAQIEQETERHRHEARVKELLERLQHQFDAMPIVCFSLSPENLLVDVNPAGEKLFGIVKSSAVGDKLPGWFAKPEQRTQFLRWLEDGSVSGPTLFTHCIGDTEVHCEWHKSVIKNAFGQTIGTLAMALNVTEKQEAEKKLHQFNLELEQMVAKRTRELEESNRELESFSYSVSHDLRAPLRAIDGFASMLCEDYQDCLPEDAFKHLQRIRLNAQRMGDLITDLLTLSRLGRQALKIEEVDLTAMAYDVWRELSTEMDTAHFEFLVEPNLRTKADASLMKQVLHNLLSNAVKYSSERPSPKIRVGSFHQNGNPGFFVEDNGVGFDMAYAPKIFEVFQRAHPSQKYEGTGVGLAIVHRIISKHKGHIWVRSAPDVGTAFFFTVGQGAR